MRGSRLSALLLVGLLHSSLYAQASDVEPTRKLGWVRSAVGAGGSFNFSGIALDFCATYLTGDGVFSIRYGGAGTLSLESVKPQEETEGVAELSGMYGISHRESVLLVTASTGLGAVRISQCGPSGRRQITTVGVPLELQVIVSPLRVIGIGVVLSGNLNPKQPFGSVMFCMQLGLVR